MNNQDIKQHERYKKMALYSYNVNENELPKGAKLVGITQHDNGYFAAIIRDSDKIIVTIRGTEGNLFKSIENIKDLQNDTNLFCSILPKQTKNALETIDIVKSMIKEKQEYNGCKIIVVGHSLGRSLAQIVAVKKGVEAITFNAYGTKNLLKNEPLVNSANVINYCNSDDDITTFNAINHVGKCYEIGTTYREGKSPHHLECMENLDNRTPITNENLQYTGERKRKRKIELKFYQKTGKLLPIRMSSINLQTEDCAGTYQVSGYIRSDGTEVSGYERTCGAKHLSKQSAREKYKNLKISQMTNAEIDELVKELI